ncbi:MAG: DUF429 domain-containing protein [Ignavibacteria bacterium]|nr:DUF429 domain-containing protein [Ignavibacteria bacterium]
MLIVGIDLAWGDKKRDGVCLVRATRRSAKVVGYDYPLGDHELLDLLRKRVGRTGNTLITVDAPIVCPNRTGTRPVDRLTHRMFHREHAACHPANSTKCPRPPRIRRKLKNLGFEAGWELNSHSRVVAEVYPHPAMVRMFRLPRIVKYKKGTVEERRKEFRRLQSLMRGCLDEMFPELELDQESRHYLCAPWTKTIEDHLDALFCALIGLWHWKHRGKRSEVIGNARTGFILLPQDLRRSP